ncbi:hypothetical protein SBA6_650004 [Candidatus Sulfopaludibacter sp. SbA6]|nr:hypothetical protein SBA6_650004 [Candidatus Sulfopaludibacter sp. SbA6]
MVISPFLAYVDELPHPDLLGFTEATSNAGAGVVWAKTPEAKTATAEMAMAGIMRPILSYRYL